MSGVKVKSKRSYLLSFKRAPTLWEVVLAIGYIEQVMKKLPSYDDVAVITGRRIETIKDKIKQLKDKGIVKEDTNLIKLTKSGWHHFEKVTLSLNLDNLENITPTELLQHFRRKYVLREDEVKKQQELREKTSSLLQWMKLSSIAPPRIEIPYKSKVHALMQLYSNEDSSFRLVASMFALGADLEHVARGLYAKTEDEPWKNAWRRAAIEYFPFTIRAHRLVAVSFPVTYTGRLVSVKRLEDTFIKASWAWPKLGAGRGVINYVTEADKLNIVRLHKLEKEHVLEPIKPTAAEAVRATIEALKGSLACTARVKPVKTAIPLVYHDLTHYLLTEDDLLHSPPRGSICAKLQELTSSEDYQQIVEHCLKALKECGVVVSVKDYLIPLRVHRHSGFIGYLERVATDSLPFKLIKAIIETHPYPDAKKVANKLGWSRDDVMKVASLLERYSLIRITAKEGLLSPYHMSYYAFEPILETREGGYEAQVSVSIPTILSLVGDNENFAELIQILTREGKYSLRDLPKSKLVNLMRPISMLEELHLVEIDPISEEIQLVKKNKQLLDALVLIYDRTQMAEYIEIAKRLELARVINELKVRPEELNSDEYIHYLKNHIFAAALRDKPC